MNAECYIIVWTDNCRGGESVVRVYGDFIVAFDAYRVLKIREATEESVIDVAMYAAKEGCIDAEHAVIVSQAVDKAIQNKHDRETRSIEIAAKVQERKEREEYERLKAKFEKPKFPECVDQEA